jgi:hypothetical protein
MGWRGCVNVLGRMIRRVRQGVQPSIEVAEEIVQGPEARSEIKAVDKDRLSSCTGDSVAYC